MGRATESQPGFSNHSSSYSISHQETEFGEVVSLSKISISAESPTLLRCANLSGFHVNHISGGGVGV